MTITKSTTKHWHVFLHAPGYLPNQENADTLPYATELEAREACKLLAMLYDDRIAMPDDCFTFQDSNEVLYWEPCDGAYCGEEN